MYKVKVSKWRKHWDFILLDTLSVQLAFCLSHILRFGWQDPYQEKVLLDFILLATLLNLLVVFIFDTCKSVIKRSSFEEFKATFKHTAIFAGFISVALFYFQLGVVYSRLLLFYFSISYFLISFVIRFVYKKFIVARLLKKKERAIVIITNKDLADEVLDNVTKPLSMYFIKGIIIIDEDMQGQVIKGIEVVGNKSNMFEYVCREWVDEVFIHLPEDDSYRAYLMQKFVEMGVTVHRKLARISYAEGHNQLIEKMGNYTVLTWSLGCASDLELAIKRLMDIMFGIVGCILAGIIFIFVAPLIYIQSPGPIFFSQIRVGKNGKKFKIYKFRSMYLDAEERKKELMAQNTIKDGMMFKIPFDNRIIGCKKLPNGKIKKGIGNIIRDYSLDEFPQFYNVLIGDMSLIGTRPPTVDEWEKYELHHRARLATKPGITGMWQVSGRSNIKDFEQVVELDKQYIENWNLFLDLKILFKTFVVVFKKEGSM